MPSHSACEREDQVVELVIADLFRSGRLVKVVDRPDRGQSPCADGLTVDVELEVDGERWAMDVTTLRWQDSDCHLSCIDEREVYSFHHRACPEGGCFQSELETWR